MPWMSVPWEGQPCDVAAWPRQAAHEPSADGIHSQHHDNRDGAGCLLGCRDRGVIARHNNVDREAPQLGGEAREPFSLPTRQAPLEGDVLPLYIAKVAQPLAEGHPHRRLGPHTAEEHAYPLHFSCWLRIGG